MRTSPFSHFDTRTRKTHINMIRTHELFPIRSGNFIHALTFQYVHERILFLFIFHRKTSRKHSITIGFYERLSGGNRLGTNVCQRCCQSPSSVAKN
jgi:hypothetical protein